MKILISIYLSSVVLFCGELIKITQTQQEDLGVRTQSVTEINNIKYGPYSGVVVLDKKGVILLSSNIESIVEAIHVRELEHVKKGQKLITLKSNALLSVQQTYIEALLEQESSDANYKRNVKLQKQGIISSKKLFASKKTKKSNDLKVNLMKAKLLTNGFTNTMLKKLKKDNLPIHHITKYARRDGVIHNVNVNIGEYVSAEHKMIEIYADGERFIEITVPVKNLKNISLGDAVSFSTFHANVSAIGNVVHNSSQSSIVRASIKNSQNIMINRIYETKISKEITEAYKIKKTALVYRENRPLIFKKVVSGFEVLDVQVIREGPTCYIVKAQLQDSDELAASSTSALLSAMDIEDE